MSRTYKDKLYSYKYRAQENAKLGRIRHFHYRSPHSIYSEYCFDYEHYDFITGRDTRDGKKQLCQPSSHHPDGYDKVCRWCTYGDEPKRTNKSKRKRSFKNFKNSYNNNNITVDEYYDNADNYSIDVCLDQFSVIFC